MATIFSRILNGEIPGYFVAQDDDFFAILDAFPLAVGHVLVIPRKEVDYIFDLDPEVLSRYMVFTRRVAKAMEAVIPCKRIGVAVIGLEVPHAHIHLVPINHVGDIDFSREKLALTAETMAETRDKIKAAFSALDQGSPE